MRETSTSLVETTPSLPTGEAFNYQDMLTLAKDLVTTGFLPAEIKTPAQAVAIILTGREIGIGPMQALRSISIVKGKPVLAADLQLALFHRAGGVSKWTALSPTEATLYLKHPCGSEHTETFDMKDAERAFSGRVPDNYRKYPKAMLRSRCITAGLKSVGFEPTTGAYDPEELGVGAPVTVEYEDVTHEAVTDDGVVIDATTTLPGTSKTVKDLTDEQLVRMLRSDVGDTASERLAWRQIAEAEMRGRGRIQGTT